MLNQIKAKRILAFVLAMACMTGGVFGNPQYHVYAQQSDSAEYSESPSQPDSDKETGQPESSTKELREKSLMDDYLEWLNQYAPSMTPQSTTSQQDSGYEGDASVTTQSSAGQTTQSAQSTQAATTQAVTTTQQATTTQQPLILDTVYNASNTNVTSNSAVFSFSILQNTASGFYIYRRSKYDSDYVKVGEMTKTKSMSSRGISYTDNTFVSGIRFTYKIVPYHVLPDGQVVEGTAGNEIVVQNKLGAPKIKDITVKGKKIKINWKKVSGVSGYEIYCITSKKWKRIKLLKSQGNSCVVKKNISSGSKIKMRGFVEYQGKRIYGDYGNVITTYSNEEMKIRAKFAQLKKKYPSYSYWNHMGRSSFNSSTVTSTPCQHDKYGLKYCNYYSCPNNIIGLQCYGFAWKMSDLIYGKNAKIKKHKSFDKAKIGDVVRYKGHSIIIVEKHKNYVVAGECNIGGTCMILWGRKVYRSELSGASYSHRTLK